MIFTIEFFRIRKEDNAHAATDALQGSLSVMVKRVLSGGGDEQSQINS